MSPLQAQVRAAPPLTRTAIVTRCIYCNSTSGPFEPDHVEPLVRGGQDVAANRVTACRRCNRAKGPRLLLEWAFGVGGLTAVRLARGERVGQLCLSGASVAPFVQPTATCTLLPVAVYYSHEHDH